MKRNSPWIFYKQLVLLMDYEGERQLSKLKFSKASFCVRMYDLPLKEMTADVGKFIGDSIGTTEEVDAAEGEVGLKERIWSRINGWKEKFLFSAGKEILLKAVIQAIPTYTISVFQLPKALCEQINSMMSKFWWGSQEKGNEDCLDELVKIE